MLHITRSLLLLLVLSASLAVHATKNSYTLSNDYQVSIFGTSNLHNWNEKVKHVSGTTTISWNADGSFSVEAIDITMDVKSIKSESSAMDKNTYKALKADAYPQITVALNAPLTGIAGKAAGTTVWVKANVTIAGVTKVMDMQIQIKMPAAGKLTFEGAQKIKMSDFGLTPPTALLGTLKTGNDITIKFKVGS
jgi:polyisoprenoid-binding protein YceI